MYVIRAVAFANGTHCPHAGQYLKNGQHDTVDGRGIFDFTSDPVVAMLFMTAGDAMAYWKRQSITMPIRPDGKPNRPLTALTVEILNEQDVLAGLASVT